MATTPRQANRVAGPAVGGPQVGHPLSPDLPQLDRELYGLISRVIRASNVDAVAGDCGVDRSTIFKWAKKPRRIFVGALETLSDYDPDPEGLMRVLGCYHRILEARALARGGSRIVIEEVSPGKWTRR